MLAQIIFPVNSSYYKLLKLLAFYYIPDLLINPFVLLQVTSKKAAIIDHHNELKDKVGGEAHISKGNGVLKFQIFMHCWFSILTDLSAYFFI